MVFIGKNIFVPKLLVYKTSLDGFEPSTFRLTAERTNPLRHRARDEYYLHGPVFHIKYRCCADPDACSSLITLLSYLKAKTVGNIEVISQILTFL